MSAEYSGTWSGRPEGGAGSRPRAVGRVRFPRARGVRTVTATRAHTRPTAARPRDPSLPLRGAQSLGRCRLGFPARGVPGISGLNPGVPGRACTDGPGSRALPGAVRARPPTPLSARAGSSRPMLAAGDPRSPDRSRAGQPATMVALRPVQQLQGG
ncbi:uncharacterized protein LOC115892833 [Rhinopithecus roxellana]|uniref:uncharacterized protein LOC115892833 n=1 Tax=Rhinopithecus roxellana TaxID=61622 RepID=UPI001237859B|nr:uncharacterized protein LOC115892833 [Rhinopithecus roxellana]